MPKMVEYAAKKFPMFIFSISSRTKWSKGRQNSKGVYYSESKDIGNGYSVTVTMKTGKKHPNGNIEFMTIFDINTTKTKNARIEFARFCENISMTIKRAKDPFYEPRNDPNHMPYIDVEFEN